MFQPTNAQDGYNHHVVNDIESESITVNPTTTTITDEAASADADAPTSNDLICGFSKKTMVAVGSGLVLIGAGAVAGTAAAAYSTQQPITTIQQSKAATGSKSGKKSKAYKKVCLEYEFLNDVVVAGSTNPVGVDGPTQLTPACLEDRAKCLDTLQTLPNWDSKECNKYLKCLSKPENGPAFTGEWWLQRDVSNGEIYFDGDEVCGLIDGSEPNSRTRLELWDKNIGMDLALFKEFSVDYGVGGVINGSGGYVNVYLRVNTASSAYYDCNLTYNVPAALGTGALAIKPDTVVSSARTGSGDNNGCVAGATIESYIAANSNAVMGVGNGEQYIFVLNTGSTGQDNAGTLVCWSNVSFTREDAGGDIYVDNYEFTTLN